MLKLLAVMVPLALTSCASLAGPNYAEQYAPMSCDQLSSERMALELEGRRAEQAYEHAQQEYNRVANEQRAATYSANQYAPLVASSSGTNASFQLGYASGQVNRISQQLGAVISAQNAKKCRTNAQAFAWDGFYGQYGDYQWRCRSARDGRFVSDLLCTGPQVDNTWPGP